MDPLMAFVVIALIFAVGDIVSIKTRALVSVLFVASVLYLFGFWTIFPEEINEIAQLQGLGDMLIGVLITHMGTLMNIKQLINQWKTVVVSIGALAGIFVLVYFGGGLLFGSEVAITAAPPLSGGVVAGLIMSETATAAGLSDLAVLAVLLVVVQGFIGYPIASFCLNREAHNLLSGKISGLNPQEQKSNISTDSSEGEKQSSKEENNDKFIKFQLPSMPKQYQTPFILLAKVGVIALIAVSLAEAIPGDIVHPFVMTLIFGIIAGEINLLEEDILTKANSFGLAILALMTVIMSNLADASPEMIANLFVPLIGTLILGSAGIAVGSSLVGKLLGLTPEMSTAIGVSALFGFPGTYIIAQEAASAVAKDEQEKESILDHILPKMLVAGFVTVTIASVLFAGVLSNWL